METMLAVDPGKFHAAGAVFVDGRLKRSGLFETPLRDPATAGLDLGSSLARFVGGYEIESLVVEYPIVYPRGPGDPNDLLALAYVAGVLVGVLKPLSPRLVTPNRWKGNVPKKVIRLRVLGDRAAGVEGRLSKDEVEILGDDPSHHIVDAVGIGLWALGRLRK